MTGPGEPHEAVHAASLGGPPCDPPYTAVIFTSVRAPSDDDGYASMAEQMVAMAGRQPGFLGVVSARDPATRLGITVSYWREEADAQAWRCVAEHRVAQQLGHERWYERYEIHVATVSRTRSWTRPDPGGSGSARMSP